MRGTEVLVRGVSSSDQVRLHAVDLENLAGSGLLTEEMVVDARQEYLQMIEAEPNDFFLVAAGPQNKTAAFEGWPDAAYTFRKGKDGADFALIDFIDGIEDKSILTSVVIASGDGAFQETAQSLSSLGIPVSVVSIKGACSRSLRKFRARKENEEFEIFTDARSEKYKTRRHPKRREN